MTNATPPFPGAKENPMLLLGLLPRTITFFDLKGDKAKNFTDASPVILKPGKQLYRVFGGGAGKIGGYWSPSPPSPGETEGDWRSENAVEPVWNAGTTVVEMTVKKGKTLQSWTGGIESQPARDDQQKIIKDWFLVGGGTQFYVNSWAKDFTDSLDFKVLGPTPWTAQAPAVSVEEPAQDVALATAPEDLSPETAAEAHVRLVHDLAAALRATAEALRDPAVPCAPEDVAILRQAANTVTAQANAMLADIGQDDAAVEVAAWAQCSLSRHIEVDPRWPQGRAAEAALEQVVHSAAALSHRAG
ncbi:MAG: hypothetical protein QNJ09_08755 [Paracoccaceae bacterium]|nr:hypothetical protein [Paracoccaceae bacterium]